MTTSEQTRADAMADAETLALIKSDTLGISFYGRRWRRTLLFKAERWGLLTIQASRLNAEQVAEKWAIRAARAAFRAVPGLRGEE